MKVVQVSDVGTNLTICSYVWRGDDFGMVALPNAPITQPSMKTLGWFGATLAGDCFDELVQLRQNPDNQQRLTLTAYRWQDDKTGFALLESQDTQSGTSAMAWLAADVDGDGITEIVQPWDDAGKAAFLVYKWQGKASGWSTAASATDVASTSIAWLAADVDGDGRKEIVQVAVVDGYVEMGVYAWDATTGEIAVRSSPSRVAPAAATTGWFSGVIERGNSFESVVQVQTNPLVLQVYVWSPTDMAMEYNRGSHYSPPYDSNVLAWIVGAVPQGYPAIIQLRRETNDGLGILVTQGSEHVWSTDDAGQRSGGNFVSGDLSCTGVTDIVQLWRTNPGTVSLSVYRWRGSDSGYVGKQFDTSQPWAVTNFLMVR